MLKCTLRLLVHLLSLLLIICSFNSCNSCNSSIPAGRRQVTIAQLRQLIGDAIRNSDTSLQQLTVKGYFVSERTPMLISDINLMRINAIIPDSAYVLLAGAGADSVADHASQDTVSRYAGAFVSTDVDLKLERTMPDKSNRLQHRIVNSDTSAVKVSVHRKPVIEIEAEKAISFINRSFQTIWPRLNRNSNGLAPKPDPNKIALLYSGGYDSTNAHKRYWNDLQFMYTTLTQQYGFAPNNIIVVYRDGKQEGGLAPMPVNYPATETDLRTAVKGVKAKLTPNSSFFLFFTNHGGGFPLDSAQAEGGRPDENSDEEISDTRKWDEEMYFYDQGNDNPLDLWDDSLTVMFSGINCKNFIVLLEPCFGGGFIHDLRGDNRVIISASSEYESSYGNYSTHGTDFDTFSYYFTAALNGADGADANKDGRISMLEAFNYAKLHDNEREHPQLEDSGDGLGSAAPSINGPYGKLANITFLK